MYRFHVTYVCSALFTVTLVSELDLEVFTVCTGILQVTESDNLFVQCCCIGCYSNNNNNLRISKMLQGSLSTSESVKTLDVVLIRFVRLDCMWFVQNAKKKIHLNHICHLFSI